MKRFTWPIILIAVLAILTNDKINYWFFSKPIRVFVVGIAVIAIQFGLQYFDSAMKKLRSKKG